MTASVRGFRLEIGNDKINIFAPQGDTSTGPPGPTEAAVENVFLATNPGSALKLGQARGAAVVAVMQNDLEVVDYSAKQIKQAVVGYGQAGKTQIQHMVRVLLGLNKAPSSDAADALAVAICHLNQLRI